MACRGSSFTSFVDVLSIFRHPRTFVDQERGAFLPAFGLPSFLPLFQLYCLWHPRTFGFPRKLGHFLLHFYISSQGFSNFLFSGAISAIGLDNNRISSIEWLRIHWSRFRTKDLHHPTTARHLDAADPSRIICVAFTAQISGSR